jgi:glycerol-3-phosphate acyltransferase PlsX
VFDGEVDALITDGFTGNVFLKTAEGIANLFLDRINGELSAILSEKPDEAQHRWRELQRHLHYAEYPGALLVGVQGLVIKCHGYSPPKAFVNGVRSAIELVAGGFMQTFQNKLDRLHSFN